jgi:hypothetical protein
MSDSLSMVNHEENKKKGRGRPTKYNSNEERIKAKHNNGKYFEKFKEKKQNYYCPKCDITVDYFSKANHLKSKKHIHNNSNNSSNNETLNIIKNVVFFLTEIGEYEVSDKYEIIIKNFKKLNDDVLLKLLLSIKDKYHHDMNTRNKDNNNYRKQVIETLLTLRIKLMSIINKKTCLNENDEDIEEEIKSIF